METGEPEKNRYNKKSRWNNCEKQATVGIWRMQNVEIPVHSSNNCAFISICRASLV